MDPPLPPEGSTEPFDQIRHAKKRLFLVALVKLGRHTRACHAVGIAHSHPWYWRRTDPTFAALEQRAWTLWVQAVAATVRTSHLRATRVETSGPDRDQGTPGI